MAPAARPQVPMQRAAAPQQPAFVPPQPPVQVAPPQANGLATAGLVVGIIAAVLSFVPVLGTVSWVLAPIALVLSVVGLVKAKRARNGRGKSIAGIVLSVVALFMCILYTAVFVGSVNSVAQQSAAVHQVTYEVTTAKKTNVTVTYSQSQNDDLAMASVADAASPWSADAQVSGLMGPTMTATLSPDLDNPGRSDTITCTIREDGVQVAQNTAKGPNASVTCAK
ncbi:hypothetical protein [Actinomycetospora soli]|uniref:hypothetical protein n=1 Tax=Actinomycetospora soli TaxID=2893887 RepID=UPI001E3DF61E|nr:hypothetical protein [Actinomycetospora soli]MCD2191459.1 hypothetical protein [Actinomycetospora soli]